ncbi:MAG: hypothetical protein JW810_08505 [Sedimentisphaerales bacterium]|nr:hypothetical protein [Sedimentisphaerales bacterium]
MIAEINAEDMLWIGSILALLLLGGVAAMVWVRRRFGKTLESDPTGNTPFTLEQLRLMRQEGQISEQEYQNLRTRVIEESGAWDSARTSQDRPGTPK